MKVRIDSDKRYVSRDSAVFEGGWYHYTVKGKQQGVDWKSVERWPTYNAAKAALLAAGHEFDNGWNYKLLTWNWHSHALDGYPGWELEAQDGHSAPAFVKLEHRRGKTGSAVESHVICSEWDDIAERDFYQRDWTSDGIPFCSEGETYWSGWWFATMAERDRFVAWYRARADRCGDKESAKA